MPTNVIYKGPDGATVIAGSTTNYGQLLSPAAAEADTDSLKVCLENVADRVMGAAPFSMLTLARTVVGTNDGVGFAYTAADPNGTISKPWGLAVNGAGNPTGAPTATLIGAAGAWGADLGTHGVVITALTALGETPASVEQTFNVGAATDQWRYDWEVVPDATGYNVYRTDVPGTYGAYSLVANIPSGATHVYTDDGAAPGAGAPPDDNTTGGFDGYTYGTPPLAADHTAADKVVATAPEGLAVGQQWFFWLMLKLPAGTTSWGNTRAFRLLPTEVT